VPVRIHRSLLGWGLFFILVGAVPIAFQAGWLTSDQVAAAWTLWPLILVAIGLGLVLRRTPLDGLGGILVAGVFGIIVGGLLAAGIGGFSIGACGGSNALRPFPVAAGGLESPTDVSIDVECGTLAVMPRDGTGYRVEGEDATGIGPDVSVGDGELTVEARGHERGLFGLLGEREDWRVELPRDVDLDLDVVLNAGASTVDLTGNRIGSASVQLNAGRAVVDLSGASSIGEFSFQANAGSLELRLPSTSSAGSIEVNAGSVKLCTTPGVAIRIQTGEGVAASYDFDGHGLVRTGSTWRSPDYSTAPVRVDLEVQGNAGSFSLDPAGGCDG
jgi:hypothetical protein